MSASSAIRQRLEDIDMPQSKLADILGTTRQNINNKFRRDNLSTREITDICKVIGLELAMIDKKSGKKYIIDYNE